MKGLLVSGHRRGSLIDLWLRGEDNKKYHITVNDFKPYFYVKNDYGEFNSIYGESLTKIFVKDPSDVPKERMRYTNTWEADIPFVRRYLIDSGISKGLEFDGDGKYLSKNNVRPAEVDIEPLILYLDIEIKPTDKGFPTPEKAEHPVVSFSFTTNKTNKYFTYIWRDDLRQEMLSQDGNNITICLENEKSLLVHFSDVINRIQPDIVTGWNIINFDMEYLRNRFKRLELRWLDERPFELFDLYLGYKHLYHQPSYQLKQVIFLEGIETENTGSYQDFSDFYFSDIKKFVEYNRRDVEYLVKIEQKHAIINFFMEIKHLVGIESFENIFYYSNLVDAKLLRKAKDLDVVLPTKVKRKNIGVYKGAYVFAEEKGLYKDVAVFDFNKYYPSIINSFYLSPENITTDANENDIISFKTDDDKIIHLRKKNGIFQLLLGDMFDERKKIEDKMSGFKPGTSEYKSLSLRRQAVKDLTNSVYGFLGYPGARLFVYELAESVTKIGREGIKFVIDESQKNGYKVLLSDTDSISIQIPFGKAQEFGAFLNRNIIKYYQEKYDNTVDISLKFEKYLKALLLTGVKKRYSMRVISENGKDCDYIASKGFENIRTDQSIFTRKLISELFELILHDHSKKEIKDFIENRKMEFSNQELSNIGISKGISKPLDQYKANASHVRGAIYANHHLNTNFGHGSKVMQLWLKGIVNYPPTNIICFDIDTKLPEGLIIDWEHMRRVSIDDKIKPILDAIGISESSKQMTLL